VKFPLASWKLLDSPKVGGTYKKFALFSSALYFRSLDKDADKSLSSFLIFSTYSALLKCWIRAENDAEIDAENDAEIDAENETEYERAEYDTCESWPPVAMATYNIQISRCILYTCLYDLNMYIVWATSRQSHANTILTASRPCSCCIAVSLNEQIADLSTNDDYKQGVRVF
jgi:hypothetical protein